MKKIITLIALLSVMTIYSQKEFTLKDGTKLRVEKFVESKGKYFYKTTSGETGSIKTKLVTNISDIGLSEKEFEFNSLGMTPYVVVEVEKVNQNKLFKKTINWIKETYKNPDKVIKAKIDNEKVRFEGFQDSVVCVYVLGMPTCYGATYTINISFKDGKYKFEPLSLSYRVPASRYVAGGPVDVPFNNGSVYYKKNGKVRTTFRSLPSSIESLFNTLNLGLKEYLVKEQNELKDDNDDW